MKRFQLLLFIFLIPQLASAQVRVDATATIPLRDPSPTTQPAAPERDDGTGRFYNVSVPVLFAWPAPAEKVTGAAIIICPGGSYDHVTMEPEGQRIAKWLNPMGVSVFGLKYRTRPPSQDAAADAMADGLRAMRLVRSRAAEWKVDPNRVGMMGYSAGANLVLNVASHFDSGATGSLDPIEKQSSRPDFVVLLSTWPNRLTLDSFPLSAKSPPAFLAIAMDDRTAPPPFSLAIKVKLDELKVPAQLHQSPTGGHGAFVLDGRNADETWKEPFLEWMKQNKLLAPQ